MRKWLCDAKVYLSVFGDKSCLLRQKLLCRFSVKPINDQKDLIRKFIKEASFSNSPYSIDNARELISEIDEEILQQIFNQALVRNESNVDFWDILIGGIVRSQMSIENKLGQLDKLLNSEIIIIREVALAALAKLAYNGSKEAVSRLEHLQDLALQEEVKRILIDLSK